jgi:hypothetical protein
MIERREVLESLAEALPLDPVDSASADPLRQNRQIDELFVVMNQLCARGR